MTWAVLSINNKGGTGKSTVAVLLAEALRDKGYDVGIMDSDIDSANLSTRLGCDKKVEFTGDHIVKPVEHEGMMLYSMENAFEESTFSQSGDFLGTVVDNMINHSEWGELDYIVIDCPPGSSDVFGELVRGLRPSILGAISVGISDAVDDTARLVKVCNHHWVPILGFVENMSGIVANGEEVTYDSGISDKPVQPFGSGKIEQFAEKVGGDYFGEMPLACHGTDLADVAMGTVDSAVEAIEEADEPRLPDDNIGDTGFIRNVWKTIKKGIEEMNERYNVTDIQDSFGVEGREPLVMELHLTDAGAITKIFDTVVITVNGGDIRIMRPGAAKRKGMEPEGGMNINSQDLYDAVRGEKEVMRSVTGEVTTEDYSITKAVQMGDAEIWGERTVNRLAVLDKILSDVVDMNEIRENVAD